MLGDTETIRIFDIGDPAWNAKISGAVSNFGNLANTAFGRTANEVLVFSDFGAKMTIWSLLNSRGVEIRDPKYAVACYDFRPITGHLALLTRGGAQDILMILRPRSYEVLKSIELGSIDAQAVQWSRDGCWIAVRDVASAGNKILIYTADGNLFRTYSGLETDSEIPLGVKCTEWTPAGTLLVGDNNDNIMLLGRNSVSLPAPIPLYYHTNIE